MSGNGPRRSPQDEMRAREQRMRSSAKKQVERAESMAHKYRAKAAAILHAEGLHEPKDAPRPGYVFKILRHRETGVRVRVLDTLAEDAPSMNDTDVVHQYLVECQTHGTIGPSFASTRAALASARRSDEWCAQCADLMSAQRTTRGRAHGNGKANGKTDGKASGKHGRRRDDIWP